MKQRISTSKKGEAQCIDVSHGGLADQSGNERERCPEATDKSTN